MNESFDVFLSHNSKDKPTVQQLAQALQARGLKVWLDEEQLVPGRRWQDALEEIIQTANTAAVLVGKDGLGPWQDPEMRACLSGFVKRRLPVIPVLLPGAPTEPELPLFLQEFTWVDLRGELTEKGLDQLQWGITGVKRRENGTGSSQLHPLGSKTKRMPWQPLLIFSVLVLITVGFLIFEVVSREPWGREYNKLEDLVGKTKSIIDKKKKDPSIIIQDQPLGTNVIEITYLQHQSKLATDLYDKREQHVVKRTYYYPENGDLLAVEQVDADVDEPRCAPQCVITDFYSKISQVHPLVQKVTTAVGEKISLQIDNDLDGKFDFNQKAVFGLFPYAYLFYVF